MTERMSLFSSLTFFSKLIIIYFSHSCSFKTIHSEGDDWRSWGTFKIPVFFSCHFHRDNSQSVRISKKRDEGGRQRGWSKRTWLTELGAKKCIHLKSKFAPLSFSPHFLMNFTSLNLMVRENQIVLQLILFGCGSLGWIQDSEKEERIEELWAWLDMQTFYSSFYSFTPSVTRSIPLPLFSLWRIEDATKGIFRYSTHATRIRTQCFAAFLMTCKRCKDPNWKR